MGEFVVIETGLGKLRGRVSQSKFSSKRYYSFLGIPFAKPPIGELRFQAPQPFGSWDGTRDALEDGHYSKQSSFFSAMFEGKTPQPSAIGDEDCLNLCVFIKELPSRVGSERPVMVSIHGGGFTGGNGNLNTFGPDFLLEEDVVVVSFNYRCGALGFLSLESEEIPGNAGLKDQTLALKWVQNNIDSFGGDPHNVTIFGVSAGGASVHYHLLSPLSKGLFQKAIIQSGFSQNLWAFQSSPRKIALKLARKLGCASEDPGEVLEFLRSVPSDDIIVAQCEVCSEKEYIKSCCMIFSPCIEVAGAEKFLPDSPNNLMKRGEYNKVPTILGICQNEGSLLQAVTIMSGVKEEELPSLINNNPELLVPPFLNLQPGSPNEIEAIKAITDFYFKGNPISLDNFFDYVKAYAVATEFLLKQHLSNMSPEEDPLRFKTAVSYLGQQKHFAKTCHGEDLIYIYTFLGIPEMTTEYRQEILKHVKAWVKFSHTGNPNSEECGVEWKRDSGSKPCYMEIGTHWTMREGTPFAERINFWQQLTDKYCKC